MSNTKRDNLIRKWFEIRFNKKPENDPIYFREWQGRFAGISGDEYPWQMDYESRRVWKRVNSL